MKKSFSFFIALVMLLLCSLPAQNAVAVELPAAGKVATGGSNLNVREKATTSSSIVSKLADQSWITLVEKNGNWWRVRYDTNKYGYCYNAYITPRSGSVHAVLRSDADTVKIYRGESTESEVKKILTAGSAVAVLTKGQTWSCILYGGTHKGYVQTNKLKLCTVIPVQLNVTRYAQNDPRWKNIAIGTKGGTIGSIGCTTTCLAMSETYLTRQTVTPAAMSRRLTYSAGGSLYWPSDYTVSLSSDDTLQQVYEQLMTGKPVVFGAKKANGTQHWVVVTGCDGSGLSPAAFSINDPATANRTTLKQYLALYPNYYKIAWRT